MAKDQFLDTNSPFQQDIFSEEVDSTYDQKIVAESRRKVARMSEEKLAAIKEEGENILRELVEVRHLGPDSLQVQMLVRRHHMNLENYYHVTQEIYQGLAELYVLDDRFMAYFNKFAQDFADFLSQAMSYYCNTEFKEIKTDRSAR